jgi:hypothetical protein
MATRLGNPLQAGGLSRGGINAGLLSLYSSGGSEPGPEPGGNEDSDFLFAGEIEFMAGTLLPYISYL